MEGTNHVHSFVGLSCVTVLPSLKRVKNTHVTFLARLFEQVQDMLILAVRGG